MCTEPTEQKLSAVFMGVSAWGFGGTNVRVPQRAQRAQRAQRSGARVLGQKTERSSGIFERI